MRKMRAPLRVSGIAFIARAGVPGMPAQEVEQVDFVVCGEFRRHPASALEIRSKGRVEGA